MVRRSKGQYWGFWLIKTGTLAAYLIVVAGRMSERCGSSIIVRRRILLSVVRDRWRQIRIWVGAVRDGARWQGLTMGSIVLSGRSLLRVERASTTTVRWLCLRESEA